MTIPISVSLASAPMHQLEKVLVDLEKAGANYIHFDIEDGSFVPALTLGIKIIRDLRPFTPLPFDIHLMMVNPEWIIPELVSFGAERISVHYEACPYPRRILRQITSLGVQAGLAINPATPLPEITYLLPYLSFVVILSTEPENPDCPFLPMVLEKVRLGRQIKGLEAIEWIVDGGISPDNISGVVNAGADMIVVGREVFKNDRIVENIAALRAAV